MDILDTVDMLESLFCMPGEFTLDEPTQAYIDGLRADREADRSSPLVAAKGQSARFTLNVSIDADRTIPLHVSLPVDAAAVPPNVHLGSTSLLDRKMHDRLAADLLKHISSMEEEDPTGQIMALAQFVKENALLYVAENDSKGCLDEAGSEAKEDLPVDTLCRIWMHLPSLSTRSKRDDMVKYALEYGITGVVCAGKPALLVLEAPTVERIESYLSFIKSHSWADIPSFQKKITERLREEGLHEQDRVFQDMQEITETVYVEGMRGPRSNRGDLGALRAWLDARGLGDRLQIVLGANFNIA